MTLSAHLSELLELLLSGQNILSISAEQIIPCVDLTLLDEHANLERLSKLKQDAHLNQVAAVCIYSKHLPLFQQLNSVQLATVINFPQGNECLAVVLKTIDNAIQLGANEIDYVFPYKRYLSGQKEEALSEGQAVINACKAKHLTLKIILESGTFPELQTLYELSQHLIALGCNFLKTSTGKIPQGASLSAVFTMLSAIKDMEMPCGIKISGGIKTPQQAFHYAKLAELIMNKTIDKSWFRIGASSLLNELKRPE